MRNPELLRLDHERNVARLRELGETRFRLLAFVPTIAGATVAILPQRTDPEDFAAVGLVGLVATLGIFLYELRNTAVLKEVRARVLLLERGLDPDAPEPARPSPTDDRSRRPTSVRRRPADPRARARARLRSGARLLGLPHHLGRARRPDVPGADGIGAIAAVVAGIAVVAEAERFAAQTGT